MAGLIALAVALVCVTGLVCWTALRLADLLVIEGEEWRGVCRYYVDGRAGLLDMGALDAPPAPTGAGIADELFHAWHDACGWDSQEQADHVKMLWRVAFRSQAGSAQKADALRELRALGAPIPSVIDG